MKAQKPFHSQTNTPEKYTVKLGNLAPVNMLEALRVNLVKLFQVDCALCKIYHLS